LKDTRNNAEHAKQDLDGTTMKGRCIRVRFASHGAAVKVKNLSTTVSNEYLEQAFSIFGSVERAVVIVDDKGRSTGEGIVEFDRKPAAIQCINKCAESCFLLTSYPKPVIVELLDQKDEEDGLSEKSIAKTPQYYQYVVLAEIIKYFFNIVYLYPENENYNQDLLKTEVLIII
jgi:splicing factor, proline- and glutamine-rich